MVLNNKLLAIRRILHSTKLFHSSSLRKAYEGEGKTTVDIINLAQEQLLISECLPVGFKMNDNSLIIGPVVLFPSTILSWNVGSGADINEASLSLFTILDPELDLLVLGLETSYPYKRILEMKETLIKQKVKSEILPVGQACGIYNFLCSEGRYVAAGLIPPVDKKFNMSKNPGNYKLTGGEILIKSK